MRGSALRIHSAAFACWTVAATATATHHVVLSEYAAAPTDGEFLEIYDLIPDPDFPVDSLVRFPEATTIEPKGVIVVRVHDRAAPWSTPS